jgi:hypothetical protein
MGTQAGVGISHHRNPTMAGKEAVAHALAAAGIDHAEFVFLFATVGYPQVPLLAAVREATGHVPLCGCSSEGIITQDTHDETNFSVAVMVIRSDELRFINGIVSGDGGFEHIGQRIADAAQPQAHDDAIALFVFPDALTWNFDRFIAGFEQNLQGQTRLSIMGGLAADNWAMRQTYQYCDDQILSDGTAWVLLAGNARMASAVTHGCIPIGAQRIITRSEGNVIYEIDHRPALEIVKEYLTDQEMQNWAMTVSNLCLAFKAPSYMEGYDDYIIRYMPTKDDQIGSVTIPTEVSAGTQVWFSRRNYDKISSGVEVMGQHLHEQLGGSKPLMVFQFDCAGRGKYIFREEQKHELLHGLQQHVGTDVPWLGFCTYGEIGPVAGRNCFHNYTTVLTVIY